MENYETAFIVPIITISNLPTSVLLEVNHETVLVNESKVINEES